MNSPAEIMPNKPQGMGQDKRPIAGLSVINTGHEVVVGAADVTAIVRYWEDHVYHPDQDQCTSMPYFAVYQGETISIRIPASAAMVFYDPETTGVKQ